MQNHFQAVTRNNSDLPHHIHPNKNILSSFLDRCLFAKVAVELCLCLRGLLSTRQNDRSNGTTTSKASGLSLWGAGKSLVWCDTSSEPRTNTDVWTGTLVSSGIISKPFHPGQDEQKLVEIKEWVGIHIIKIAH